MSHRPSDDDDAPINFGELLQPPPLYPGPAPVHQPVAPIRSGQIPSATPQPYSPPPPQTAWPPAPTASPYPRLVEPNIWQYDDNVFVWLDETGNVGGGDSTLSGAKYQIDRYGDYLEGVGPDHVLTAPGYEQLAQVLADAFHQASAGKGKERHANDLAFHDQPMQQIATRRGIGFILGQADKKSEEAQGMLERGQTAAAIHELLGAIVYLSGAIIHIRNQK